jgi:sugar phosphate isomerase/epimerase
MNRRDSLVTTLLASTGFGLVSCRGTRSAQTNKLPARERIAFNTANLVGRVSGYRYELKNWGAQHQKTVAETDERAWRSICADIAAAGYRAVEIWEAHAAPESLNESKAGTWRSILRDHGLRPVAYAGGLRAETLRICQWLEIAHIDGGLRGNSPESATQLCREFNVQFNLENHPEKSAAEVRAGIGGGNDWLGVCVDTGWFGTQGANVPATIHSLGPLVRHTHIKDVRQAGGHETCRLGDGVVQIPATLAALREINYQGWYSWEDEPEDRNPLALAAWTRGYLHQQI